MSISPLVYKNLNNPSLPFQLGLYLKYYIALCAISVALGEVFGPPLVNLMFDAHYANAGEPISIIILSIFLSNMYMFYPGIILREKTMLLAIINLGGLLINIPLNFALIPILGGSGAAVATLVSSVFALSLHIVFSQHWYRINMKTTYIFILVYGFSFLLVLREVSSL